ncbi:MAG: ACT domain-containing protein [Thermomicrobiales bacterium]
MSDTPASPSGLRLDVLPGTYAVCRLPADAPIPVFPTSGAVRSITVTAHEISIVCPESDAPVGAEVDGGWSALYILGPVPFDLAGVLVSVLAPLSGAGLGVFALSTYDSDVVLVRANVLERAASLLRAAGHTVRTAE